MAIRVLIFGAGGLRMDTEAAPVGQPARRMAVARTPAGRVDEMSPEFLARQALVPDLARGFVLEPHISPGP
jgi:hypothetical protein